MPKAWAIAGVDLHLEPIGSRKRAGLESALRDAVSTGRLAPGTRLPSSRALAADLGIARNTVAGAYSQLVAEGWLMTAPGSGTRVARLVAPPDPALAPAESAAPSLRYDLRPGSPDLSAFPRSAWLTAARRGLATAPYEALGHIDPRGLPELRRALAEYLARARGVRANPDRIVICSGFTQGFGLLCQVLRARGANALAVEQYLQPSTYQAATAAGLSIAMLRIDHHGPDVNQLGGADAALLTPAHQFPLGVALSARRRAQAIDWAINHQALLIEDDYDGEFRYDRQPLGALQALAPEHVVYAGTASKTLAPGLRLGWLVLPPNLIEDVTAAKALADRHSSSIDQLTLTQFIVSGAYDRHIRRARLIYRRRRDRLIAALRQDAPQVRISGIAAGLHALIQLGDGQDEQQILAQAAQRSLALQGLGSYAQMPGEHAPALVVGYATPPEHAFTPALARLTAVLAPTPALPEPEAG